MLADDSDTPSVSKMSASVRYDAGMRPIAPILCAALAGLMLAGCDGAEPAKPAPPVKSEPAAPAPLLPSKPPVTTDTAALQRLPMPRILAIATARVAGEVLEVEFDEADEKNGPEYEVSILTPDGRILEVKLDAISGKILKIEED